MSANQGRFRVATMARMLGVSPSGYYAGTSRPAPVLVLPMVVDRDGGAGRTVPLSYCCFGASAGAADCP